MNNGPYTLVIAPKGYAGKKYRGRYAYEHHVVWWKRTGKSVPKKYVLHHKNGKKKDNRFSNLELLNRSEHGRTHARPIAFTDIICGWCQKPHRIQTRRHRAGLKIGRTKFFCSQSCGALNQFRAVPVQNLEQQI